MYMSLVIVTCTLVQSPSHHVSHLHEVFPRHLGSNKQIHLSCVSAQGTVTSFAADALNYIRQLC